MSGAIAPFVRKTFQLVSDKNSDDIVSWNSGGKSFTIWDSRDFEKHVLPQYFKHNNICSFIRQLNTYGFRKINAGVPDALEFAHPSFLQNKKNLLHKISRKSAVKASKQKSKAVATKSQKDVAQTLFALVKRQKESEQRLNLVLKELEETRSALRSFQTELLPGKRSFQQVFPQEVEANKRPKVEIDVPEVQTWPMSFDDLFRESAVPISASYCNEPPMFDHSLLENNFMSIM
uniref:HSF-type DNA-binding domain-containing protein n=1 Tax=Vannella robusta TaxID=1487602 RepID=A0A7S4M4U8_9EUKA|mmetsp:Transcript_11518/g.14268  ORF Transcript_11518/g.14268 Transcript_11518/m.14268 type:complete len:233 (+) Transcript_11518:48-746(+)|eukprot:CAMPEP_0206188608 /NCGR_PEP_ID=MMETSP0166-20121206/3666_1 /ASSEMBLY_ACC=CAM_ASM_000260 /TAXON_ID=95228 /ORGANISM="Vannella robusta, Strain DIVA3 518/3/11/1/6" /LENGTH=232 /DNA_ID=CAMNT_0053604349 /DNA_START=32 /DNA_END=730 /DNA_ORIENTATION=-